MAVTTGLLACEAPLFPVGECYRGLALGDVVELELLARYERDGPYEFWDMSLPDTYPSCEGMDGLDVGSTLRFELVSRGTAADECLSYWGDLQVLPTGVTRLPQPSNGSGVLLGTNNRFSGPACEESYWQIYAFRHLSLDDDPFGEVPVEGQLPPVVVRREINACGCIDRWVATIRQVEVDDAGVENDAR